MILESLNFCFCFGSHEQHQIERLRDELKKKLVIFFLLRIARELIEVARYLEAVFDEEQPKWINMNNKMYGRGKSLRLTQVNHPF
jgi:hypothetical protein